MTTVLGTATNDILNGTAAGDLLNGLAGADQMIGGLGDDTYVVDNAGDVVTEAPNQGWDTIESSVSIAALAANVEQVDLLGGSALNATGNTLVNALDGNMAANTLDGGAGNDTLFGYGGNDALIGGTGNDYLDGGAGADTMTGGTGDDFYLVDNAGDKVVEAANGGIDSINANFTFDLSVNGANVEDLFLNVNAGAINGYGNALNNVLVGNGAANLLEGGAGNDELLGNGGGDGLYGGAGNDTLEGGGNGGAWMAGGTGNDIYYVDDPNDVVAEQQGEGTDTVITSIEYDALNPLDAWVENLKLNGSIVNGYGNGLDNTITGNAADNALSGGAGNDAISGLDGNDTIDGGTGNDTMTGGTGDDFYYVDSAGDKVIELANQGIDGVYASVTSYTMAANVEQLFFINNPGDVVATGNTLDNFIIGSANGDDKIDGGAGNDTIFGNTGNDYLIGNTGDDQLFGNTGNDKLDGGAGNDTLDGGTSGDWMAGGAGDDTYYVDDPGDVVTELANQGHDTIIAAIDFDLSQNGANVEDLILGTGASSPFNGTGNALDNHITGNANNNTLDGGAGNDTLDGGTGVDKLIGGAGNDTYIVDTTTDTVYELSGGGTDAVKSSVDYSLAVDAPNVENLVLTGTALHGYGSGVDNVITGNAEDNFLEGYGGNDALIGGAGADSLVGDAGNNTMSGGTGDDTYSVYGAGDKVIENANEGFDTVNVEISSYTLTANVEELNFDSIAGATSGIGNTLNNILLGSDVGLDKLDGGAGDDYVRGFGGSDTLIGGTGNDTLDGGTGSDTMTGGAGDDDYYVDNTGDKVIEAAGQGTDTILSTIDFDLSLNGANVEILRLGSTASHGTGNALDNTIYGYQGVASTLSGLDGNDTLYGNNLSDTLNGGNGNDALDGFGGTDTMTGGAGNDTYHIDSLSDVVNEQLNGGTDTVVSDVDLDQNHLLANNVENLILTINASNGYGNTLDNTITADINSASDALYGQAGNDTLIGGNGHDIMIGGIGNDTMKGGEGDDLYYVGDAGDKVIELANGGTDEVDTYIDYTLPSNVENLYVVGTVGDVNGTGNSLNNTIYGNTHDNKLDGGAGNDQLFGDDGNDTLIGGTGDDALNGGTGVDAMTGGTGNDFYTVDDPGDTVIELANQGNDTILTSISFDLSLHGANVENLYLEGGAGGISGTGNALDNTIDGNGDNNLIDGKDGNDTLKGGGGGDTLDGGNGNDALDGETGADVMNGGAGNDTYYIDDVGDQANELAGNGIDTIITTLTNIDLQANFANVENLTFAVFNADVVGSGTGGDNVITGGAGNDMLNGQDGNDVLNGMDGDDQLHGSADQDILNGGNGDDTLDGGAGNDVMTGGNGDDTYYVNTTGDKVTELANQGHDAVHSYLNHYVLGANFEDLVFDDSTGGGTGTGNTLDNTMTGADTGTDLLDGGAGNDVIHGQGGNDHVIGNTGDDVLYGDAGADILDGGVGNDVLLGGTGGDTMIGGAGNDTYLVDDPTDVVTELPNQGTDQILSTISFDLNAHGQNVENLTLIGANLDGTGNALDNVINGTSGINHLDGGLGNDTLFGNDGDDTLTGGAGNDVLNGGLGADVMDGGAGNDVFRYDLGNNSQLGQLGGDTINNFETGKDKIDLHDLFTDFSIPQGTDPFAGGYLKIDEIGLDSVVKFDSDGGGNSYVTLATVHNAAVAVTDLVF